MSSIPTTRTQLAVWLADGDDTALLRVLCALHRRRATIVGVHYAQDRAELVVDAPAIRAHCLPAWLEAIVGVERVSAARALAQTGESHG